MSQTWNIGNRAACFATTHWSVVLRAGSDESVEGSAALEKLCADYWYPLYVYVRRLGHSAHEAQDLTQGFFAYLLQADLLAKADPDAGHFRSFLLGSLRHYMANEWRRQHAQKRGSGAAPISIDAQSAEERYQFEPADPQSPVSLYEQAWAVAVLNQALAQLEQEHKGAGKGAFFDVLHPLLQGGRTETPYVQLAAKLGTTEGALKVTIHRMRQRYRELLRATVAHTMGNPTPQEVDAELRFLLQVLSR